MFKPTISPHLYAGNRFNRLAERRKDESWLRAALADTRTLFLPMHNGRHLITPEPVRMSLLSRSQLALDISQATWVLLGEFNEQVVLAVELSDHPAAAESVTASPHSQFEDLRVISEGLDRDEAGLLAYARALLLWHRRHRFCGVCGSPTTSIQAGHARQCTSADCAATHFPRLDPAIIVLVTDGERVLLGRQPTWPPGRYSTIAGFVEWGESIEEAVVREVREEAGILIDAVHYQSSQPWPFPSSLMLGFIAHAQTTTIHCADLELEDAQWFTPAALACGAVMVPPRHTLSHHLIDTWYRQQTGRALQDEPGVLIARLAQPSRAADTTKS